MKVGDKMIVDPRLSGTVFGIPVKDVQRRILTIQSIYDYGSCLVEESKYIFDIDMLIPIKDTLSSAIHKRRQYEARRQSNP